MEQGRTVGWNQQLRLRGDLGDLARRRRDLAERLDRVRRLLDRPVDGAAGEPDHEGRRVLAAEWDTVVAQVRDLDGFAHFLEPRPVHELRAAAEAGPVVIVNVAAHGCHALVLQPPDGRGGGRREPVRVVALPGLTRSEALARARGLRRTDRAELAFDQRQELIDDLLDWLWRVVAGPVLDAVGPAERLWWCLTGPLTQLPVHAARPRGGPEPEHRMGGCGIPSYTVTVDALLRSRRPSAGRRVRQLVVGVPEGDISGSAAMTPLPSAAREVTRVAARARLAGPVRELVGPAATRQRVRAALSGYDRVHLACHVRQNAADPAGTGLLLADGLLTVAQLAELDLPDAELAVLTACATAVGSDLLPEEAVHVAAALQVIGYRHVVATLWSVPDAAGPQFADVFYYRLGDGRSATGVREALLHAVRAIQERYADRSPAWAPYVHFGS